MGAGADGLDHLAADRGRRLFAAALEGAVRAVHVVIPADPRLQPEVFAEMAAHPLAEQLLPAVAVLRHGRVGVGLGKWNDVGGELPAGGIDASRGGEEVALHRGVAGRYQKIGIDQDGQHAVRLVGFDEPHAAHIGGQVVDDIHARDRIMAGVQAGQVGLHRDGAGRPLIPLLDRLAIDQTQPVSLGGKCRGKMTADEATSAGDQGERMLFEITVHVVLDRSILFGVQVRP